MRFKVDENLPIEAASIFRARGFEADTVRDESLSGADDEAIASRVRVERRILVTLDLDFSNIRAYPPEGHAGIIVLRLKTRTSRLCSATSDASLWLRSNEIPKASYG